MSNVKYSFDGSIGYGKLQSGLIFLFDAGNLDKIKDVKWYPSYESGRPYLIDRWGNKMHNRILHCPKGYEVDHISLDTLDNRICNLRICTHQQNQMNQPLQKNNTSGVCGVSWYPPRNKYRARIKAGQCDIHLGYYRIFMEAVQARNIGMECMFGEFGRYNDAPPAPVWIRNKVVSQCKRFAELSVCRAFLISEVGADGE